jgi:PIN domain nuclease of toxin-antitoxin system
MAIVAVADTHALIWYADGRWHKLGREARRAFEQVNEGDGAIFVPTLAMVELGEAVRRRQVALPEGVGRWGDQLFATGRFFPVELTWSIVKRSEELLGIPERGDRLIAATAVELGYPLITRDHEIIAASGVETIW